MRLLAFFALSAALAQSTAAPVAQKIAAPALGSVMRLSAEVPRCPSDFRPKARTLRLIEVPEGPTGLANQIGRTSGTMPPAAVCVLPAK